MTSTEPRPDTATPTSGALPPIDWYRDPGLTEPTPVTITADGHVYGHVACWNSNHVGLPGQNVRPPRSRTDYSYYHVGSALVSDAGTPVEISVGRLVQGTGHAPLTSDAAGASDWYDSTGAIVATVCAGEDAHGIWFSGALAPGLDEVSMYRLRASAISGDWRPINNSLELTAALCVPSPGFPIPRARVASAADLVPIVAAGMVPPRPTPHPTDLETAVTTTPDTPETLLAASDGPPLDVVDTPDGGGGFEPGDTVTIEGTKMVGQVVEAAGDGMTVVELPVPTELLSPAGEVEAVAAAARFTAHMHDRRRDADLVKLSGLVASLTDTVKTQNEQAAAQSARLDELLAKNRAAEAERLIASAGLA